MFRLFVKIVSVVILTLGLSGCLIGSTSTEVELVPGVTVVGASYSDSLGLCVEFRVEAIDSTFSVCPGLYMTQEIDTR